jgi:ribonuclease P protein component
MAVGESSFQLPKQERLTGMTLIEKLFNGGNSRALTAFPLRMVYMAVERDGNQPAARILVSVPKRYFKRAVKRNRVKRQVREAFRLNKHLLHIADSRQLLLAFIWMDNRLHDTDEVERKVKNLLIRLDEREQQQNPSE